MNVLPTEYKFKSKDNEIYIVFHQWMTTTQRHIFYCTISIESRNGKHIHYHDAVVFNPHDNYNQRTGFFLAFKKALKQRWYQRYRDPEDELVSSSMEYYEYWAHYLAALMDGKVLEDGNDPYSL